jgi:hypothetical protein
MGSGCNVVGHPKVSIDGIETGKIEIGAADFPLALACVSWPMDAAWVQLVSRVARAAGAPGANHAASKGAFGPETSSTT